jgi:NAD(P)-dependent dehydrogenase (short-subunit alcohol dehydrogenase family)
MASRGRIINISNIIVQLGSYMLAVYGALNGAVNALMVALANDGPKASPSS